MNVCFRVRYTWLTHPFLCGYCDRFLQVISNPVASELMLPTVRTRHCRVPTINLAMVASFIKGDRSFWCRDTARPCPDLDILVSSRPKLSLKPLEERCLHFASRRFNAQKSIALWQQFCRFSRAEQSYCISLNRHS